MTKIAISINVELIGAVKEEIGNKKKVGEI